MRTEEVRDRIEEIRAELEEVRAMSEKDVCERYNADSKAEIVALIQEEIAALETGYECLPDDDGMDYVNLQLSQGMAAVFW